MYYCAASTSTGLTGPIKTSVLWSRKHQTNVEHLIHHLFLTEMLQKKKMMPPKMAPTKYATVMGDHSVLAY